MYLAIAAHVRLMISTLNMKYGLSLIDLVECFASRNYEIRLAGETARDILMNKIPKNIDLVTSASLYQMKKMFVKNKIAIAVNKIDATITLLYGYITYRIATVCPIELKSQPQCDGTRRAHWMIHAYNRIFTINSILIGFDGRIYDYFNGYNDVKNHHIRMNMDPDTLIRADYLRILKYFKLFGSVAKEEQGHDPNTLAAIMANINGLASIKGELVWSEFKTILMHPNRYECIESFIECGGATFLGLPEHTNLLEFQEIASYQSNFAKHPLLCISYLCAFLETREDVMKLHQRLRLSAYERDLALFIVKHKTETRNIDDLIYYRKMCLLPTVVNKQVRHEYVLELLKYHNKKTQFENLLLMESPFHHIDPVQLRTITDGTDLSCTKENDNENESTQDSTKQLLRIGLEWRVIEFISSSKKKQRLQ